MAKGVSVAPDRVLSVHLLPGLVPPAALAGAVAVVIDVLRATTTVVHALAAGCSGVWPCAEVAEAKALATGILSGRVLLAGERGGLPVAGFDLGNSPRRFNARLCGGIAVVLTTTNFPNGGQGFLGYNAASVHIPAIRRPAT